MKTLSLHTRRTRNSAGFTLVETLIASSLATIVIAGAYTFLTAAMNLYADNVSLNLSHQTARLPLERIIREVNNAGCPPILVDEKGADIAGNGPAPGIRYCTLASPSAYTIAAAALATSTTVSLKVVTGQAKPRPSDILLIHASPNGQPGNGIQMEITAVAGGASPYTLTLKSAVGTPIPVNSSALILQQAAFITNGGQLRYYNKFVSEAKDGATVFNAATSFRSLAQVEPMSNVPPAPVETLAKPFSYTPFETRQSLDPHLLRVNLRARSAAYSNVDGAAKFNSFLNMQSSIAVKSAYVDSTKLNATQ
jgi:type II secretory pathway pseudopilin PulG